jgi:hypothetical protein
MNVKRGTGAGLENRTEIFGSIASCRWNQQGTDRSHMLAANGPPRFARQREEPGRAEGIDDHAIDRGRSLGGPFRPEPIEVPKYLSDRQRRKLLVS